MLLDLQLRFLVYHLISAASHLVYQYPSYRRAFGFLAAVGGYMPRLASPSETNLPEPNFSRRVQTS